MHDEQRQVGFMDKAVNMLGLLSLVAQTLAVSVEVILHKRLGRNALGMPAFFATLVIPFWGAFFPGDDLRPLFVFWLLFIGGCLVNRLFPAPTGEHTRYNGFPRLMRLCPRADEAKFKGRFEPLVVFFFGIFFMPASEALGSYLMLAAFGLGSCVAITQAARRAQVEQLSDARIEQEQMAEEFRRVRGE